MNSPSPEHSPHEHHHAMPRAAEGSGNGQGATLLLSIPTLLWSGISGTILGRAGFLVTQRLSYTQVSRRGEVAERLKAAVC